MANGATKLIAPVGSSVLEEAQRVERSNGVQGIDEFLELARIDLGLD